MAMLAAEQPVRREVELLLKHDPQSKLGQAANCA